MSLPLLLFTCDLCSGARKIDRWVRADFCSDEIFVAKLAEADKIEGCPDYYQRAVARVELLSGGDQPGEGVSSSGHVDVAGGAAEVKRTCTAYVYHRTTCKRDLPIESGDWMRREAAKHSITEEDLKEVTW